MAAPTSAVRDAWRVLANAPVAASVAARHLAQGSDHAASVARRLLRRPSRPGSPGPQASLRADLDGSEFHHPDLHHPDLHHPDLHHPDLHHPDLHWALSLQRAGELTEALGVARAVGGVRGRALAAHLAGELAVLQPSAPRTSSSRPARVLHLVTNALPEVVAGYTVRTQGIAEAQRAAGLDARVATRLGFPVTKGRLRASAYVEVDGVPYHRTLVPVPLRRDAALARDVDRTTRLVQRLRPDVLHAHSNHLNGQVALAVGRRLGVPVVYEVRGFIEETRRSDEGEGRHSEQWRLTRAAESWCMERADAVITLSESMRAELLERGIADGKVMVCPNAVAASWLDEPLDPPGVHPGVRPGGPVGRPAGYPDLAPGTVVAGVVGTLNGYEGVDVLVRAVASLSGVHLLVVGDGPARAELEELAAGGPVTFVGRVPVAEVPRWHSAIDVYCVPRVDLPVTRLVPPLKPVEAMAAGRPVVASDLPPLRELVRDGETGVIVPPGDVTALAAALDRLARDPELRHKLGAAGRSEVALTRTWAAVADRCTDLYTRLLDGSHHPPT